MKHPLILAVLLLMPLMLAAQPTWQRSETTRVDIALFHSTVTANFPTTETLKGGDFEYEISHRFIPSIKDGYDVYFGLDGPARIRTALSFGITNRLMVTLGRSNNTDNLDLQLKHRLFQIENPTAPTVAAMRIGVAWNSEVPTGLERSRLNEANFQYYVQLVANTMLLDRKLGIGLVPSYLYNSMIYSVDKEYTLTLGGYVQYFLDGLWSVWVDYNATIAGYQGVIRLDETGKSHNSVGLGLDITTGGHVFHLFITNNARLNPSQYIVGADRSARDDMMRLGFGITRYL